MRLKLESGHLGKKCAERKGAASSTCLPACLPRERRGEIQKRETDRNRVKEEDGERKKWRKEPLGKDKNIQIFIRKIRIMQIFSPLRLTHDLTEQRKSQRGQIGAAKRKTGRSGRARCADAPLAHRVSSNPARTFASDGHVGLEQHATFASPHGGSMWRTCETNRTHGVRFVAGFWNHAAGNVALFFSSYDCRWYLLLRLQFRRYILRNR